ncbi:MAG TPA: flagellar hook-length control protein FliK, partial [Nitrospira sp.]|nr:flagellar hook-length control protein FliK [Nitrospira sp.]
TDRTDRADASTSKTSERDRSDENMNKSAQASKKDVAREDGERSTVKDDARSDSNSSGSQSVSAPAPLPIATQTINQEQTSTDDGPRSSEDEHQATTASSMSTLIPSEAPMPSMTAPEAHKGASSSDETAAQSKDQPEQASAMSALSTKGDAQAGPIVKDDVQAVVSGTDTKTVVAAVEPHAASSGEEADRSRPQSDAPARRESNLNSGQTPNNGGIDRPMNDAVRMVEGVTLVRPVSPHSDGHVPSRGDKEEVKSKTEVVLPIEDPAQFFSDDGNGESKVSAALLRGQQSSFDVTKHFVELKAGHIGSPHDQAEIELPQAAVGEHQAAGGQPTGAIMAGAQGGISSSSPPPPPTTPFVSHAPPAVPGHDPGDKSAQVMTRSVVFDVAQPDLGHVNIRVAMTNDVVHTHLSADRPEVGQFLVNGQDRLQAAFQANGLDMGQFRVDIDRQSGGRSFQHGPSQEQGQAWNQGSQGMNWGQSQDRQDEQHTSLHGLLNLVA